MVERLERRREFDVPRAGVPDPVRISGVAPADVRLPWCVSPLPVRLRVLEAAPVGEVEADLLPGLRAEEEGIGALEDAPDGFADRKEPPEARREEAEERLRLFEPRGGLARLAGAFADAEALRRPGNGRRLLTLRVDGEAAERCDGYGDRKDKDNPS